MLHCIWNYKQYNKILIFEFYFRYLTQYTVCLFVFWLDKTSQKKFWKIHNKIFENIRYNTNKIRLQKITVAVIVAIRLTTTTIT